MIGVNIGISYNIGAAKRKAEIQITPQIQQIFPLFFTYYDKNPAGSLILTNNEREKIETALRESRERLKVLFDFAPDGYCMLSLKGVIIEGNQSVETITGVGRDAFIGKKSLILAWWHRIPTFRPAPSSRQA